MAKIEDHKYSIEEAFRECFYVVPDYQREYVWTEKEVNQLLGDIDEQLDIADRREYFKGMRSPAPLGDFLSLEIEHILPNTPADELLASFTDANPGKTYDEQKARLGNLTLLEKPINIVIGNGFFGKKRAEYPSLEIGPLLDSHKHDIGQMLRESLEHEGQALAYYKELLKVVEGASVMLEEYAREMVLAEELHAGEVNKMLRKPGEIDAFRPARAAEGSLTRNA